MSNRKTSKSSESKLKKSETSKSETKHTVVPPKAEAAKPVIKEVTEKTAPVAVAKTPATTAATVKVEAGAKETPKAESVKAEAATASVKADCCGGHSECAGEAKSASQSHKNHEGVQAQLQALRSSSADDAREAAMQLGCLGDAAAVEPLIEVLFNTDGYFHSVVRAAAAESLARLGDVRAVDALIFAVRDPMAEASAEAVRALANLKDPRAISPLIDVVRNSWGFFLPIVRRAAVLALAKIGGSDAVAELHAVAADQTEDAVVRQAAIEAIA